MLKTIKEDIYSRIASLGLIVLTVWWFILFVSTSTSEDQYLMFGAIYGTSMAGFGCVVGLLGSRYWGGWNSVLGRAMIFLSLGMFAQFIGQFAFSYYNIFLHIDIPYPSLADIGYFGAIPIYIYGILLLAQASGVKVSLKSFASQMQAFLIPVAMVGVSYFLFLRKYDFSEAAALTVFLDFGYPIGQGLFISLAILTYSLSRNLLGGIMKSRILLIVIAFVCQYIADFNFLYENLSGTWYNGGYGDYLYLIAYFFMAVGLFQLRAVAAKLHSKSKLIPQK